MITIHLRQIAEGESFHLKGETDAAFLDLKEASCEAVGPFYYDLQVGVSGSGIFATGYLSQSIRTTCVGCLEPFEYEITTNEFAMQRELDGCEEVDLTPEVREDIQLLLPMHPRCDLGGISKCPVQFPKTSSRSAEVPENRPFSSLLDNITH